MVSSTATISSCPAHQYSNATNTVADEEQNSAVCVSCEQNTTSIAKAQHSSLIEPAPPAYETLDMPGDDLSSSDEPPPAYSSVVTMEQDNEVEEISSSLFGLSVVWHYLVCIFELAYNVYI